MSLTPIEMENARFRVGFRGYAREDVERFRETAVRAVEEYIAEAARLRARVSELEAELVKYKESEELLKNSVVHAQRISDELVSLAHKRAELIEQEAQAQGDEIRRRLGELTAQREQFEYAFHGLLSGFLRRLESGNPALSAFNPATAGPAPAPAPPLPLTAGVPPAPAPQNAIETASQPPPRFEPPRPAPPQPAPIAFSAALPPAQPPGAENERDSDAEQFSAALSAVKVEPPSPWPPPPLLGGVDPAPDIASASAPAEPLLEQPAAAETAPPDPPTPAGF